MRFNNTNNPKNLYTYTFIVLAIASIGACIYTWLQMTQEKKDLPKKKTPQEKKNSPKKKTPQEKKDLPKKKTPQEKKDSPFEFNLDNHKCNSEKYLKFVQKLEETKQNWLSLVDAFAQDLRLKFDECLTGILPCLAEVMGDDFYREFRLLGLGTQQANIFTDQAAKYLGLNPNKTVKRGEELAYCLDRKNILKLTTKKANKSQNLLINEVELNYPTNYIFVLENAVYFWSNYQGHMDYNEDKIMDYLPLITKLLENGADPNILSETTNNTLLHIVCSKAKQDKAVELAKLLIKHGALFTIEDINGKTPLEIITDTNCALYHYINSLNYKDQKNNMIKYIDKKIALTKLLDHAQYLEQNKSNNIQNVEENHDSEVQLEGGTDTQSNHLQDYSRLTAYELTPLGQLLADYNAKQVELKAIAKKICSLGGNDVNKSILNTEAAICTPLHYAVQNQMYSLAELLLNFGASTNIKNHNQLTPLELAIEINTKSRDMFKITNLLLKYQEITLYDK